MPKAASRPKRIEAGVAGFGTLDEKGRLSLTKPIRQALGIEPGSTVAYIVVAHGVLVIPQDEHLAALMQEAAEALRRAGLTSDDVLALLPEARDEVMREHYGDALLRELSGEQPQTPADNTRGA